MDELYGNAWGESVKSASSIPPKRSWSSPKLSPLTTHDEEADLAAPSWSTGAGMQWDEPSADSHGFSWSQTEPDLAWGTSTYDSIKIGKSVGKPAEEQTPASPSETHVEDDSVVSPEEPSYRPISPLSPTQASVTSSEPPTSPVSSPVIPRPVSPDGFGTFESAFEGTDSAFPPGASRDLDDDAWGSAWATSAPQEPIQDEPVDEWEAAKLQKEKLDHKVPPELQASLMRDCNKLCEDLFPEPDPKFLDTDKDSWRNNWRNGMDGVEGLEAVMKEYVPELTLQPLPPFAKTAIAKNMASTIRLTKNLPLVKTSPMSYYLASKGSTAWERALKDRKDVAEEDVVPVGWRILEKDFTSPTASTSRPQKPPGRLFSFWGRRDSKASVVSASSSMVSRDRSPSSASGSESSTVQEHMPNPRASQDSARSIPTQSSSFAPSAAASLTPSPALPSSSTPASIPESSTPPVSSSSASYAEAPLPDVERSQSAPQAAPSAVSRFFHRFSRRRSTLSTTSPRNSIALSSDDLEFLSDIVPSVSDDADDDPFAMRKALSEAIKPEPLPPLLPPPPAAPLPRPLSQPTGASKTLLLIDSSASAAGPSKALPPNPQAQMSTLDSFFDALEESRPSAGPKPASTFALDSTPLQPTAPHLPPLPSLSPPPISSTSSRPQSPPVSLSSRSTRSASPSPLSSMFPSPIVEKPASQPFSFPPPPSSRSQTPSVSNRESVTLPVLVSNRSTSSVPSRPKIPLAFTIPFPPSSQSPASASTSSSPVSRIGNDVLPSTSTLSPPSSAVPLAVLYPNAVPKPSAPATSKTTSPVSRVASPFLIPPPPSSLRSQTPVLPTAVTSSTAKIGKIPPILPPPMASTSRPPTAPPPPLPLSSFDDDDFADFQSSSNEPPQPIPSTPDISLSSPAMTQPLMPSNRPVPLSKLKSFTSSIPSISSLKQMGVSKPSISSTQFEDGFSDFHSSVTPVTAGGTDDFDSSFASQEGLLPSHTSLSSGFDDFGSFSNTLRTPSPPRPPSKTPPPALPLSKPSPITSSPPTHLKHSKKLSRAQNQHTLSLLDFAASKKGQWPAPPSPLPAPLSFTFPVPAGPGKNSKAVDLMGDEDSFGSFNSDVIASSVSSPAMLTPSNSKPPNGALFPPPPSAVSQSQSLQTMSSTGSGQWLLNTGSSNGSVRSAGSVDVKNTNGISAAKGKIGGLSAQDLSFFEGL